MASDSAHDNSAPRLVCGPAGPAQGAQPNSGRPSASHYRTQNQAGGQAASGQAAPGQFGPAQGASSAYVSGQGTPASYYGAGQAAPWGANGSSAQLTAGAMGPLGPGLSPFGMGAAVKRKPHTPAPAATVAQGEYLQYGAHSKKKRKIASASELADEFAADLAQEQQLHAWPTDPAARTKVSLDELIAKSVSSDPRGNSFMAPPVGAGASPASGGLTAQSVRTALQTASPQGVPQNRASQGGQNAETLVAPAPSALVAPGPQSGTLVAQGPQSGALVAPGPQSGTLVAQGPQPADLVALTPQQQLEQSIAARDALGTDDAAVHGENIVLPHSGQSAQDEFAGFEQAAKLRREDRRRTQQAVSALDVLFKQIEERSGIKVDEVEVDPFEYYVIRKNETKEVAAAVAQRKEEYFRSFIDKLRADGQINQKYTLESLQRDELNRHAFTLGERFVQDIASKLARKLFLLFGDMGTGKTVLAHALANLFMDLKAQDPDLFRARANTQMPLCMVVTLDDLKRSWFFANEETYEQRTERERKLKQYYEVDLLVLDGLCCDFVALTPFNQRSLNDLLRYRAEHNLPMIVTTPIRLQVLHQAVGDAVYEGLKSFEVTATALLGGSRRAPILMNGAVIP